jgi:ribosomal-protein-alanine N-acetyltransferase
MVSPNTATANTRGPGPRQGWPLGAHWYAPLAISPPHPRSPGDMNTPRTSIRLIGPDDAGALAAHFARDAEAFARWDPEWPPDYYTAAGQRVRIERMLKRHDSGETWPGVVLADDVVIGQVTIQNIVRRAWRKAELGYWIGDPHQGEGHATRAVGLAVQMMITELDLHRAEAITQMDNLGSQHVLRNNGFVPYGVARSRIFTAGMWRDEILWERLLDQ